MSEVKNVQWLEGFTKFATDCGVSDPQAIVSMLKTHQTLQALRDNPAEFEKGAAAVMEKAGQNWKSVLALLAGGIGAHALTKGYQGFKRNLGDEYMGDIDRNNMMAFSNMRNQMARAAYMKNMINPQKSQPSAWGVGYPINLPLVAQYHDNSASMA